LHLYTKTASAKIFSASMTLCRTMRVFVSQSACADWWRESAGIG
jgi:hypothetical protein